MADLRRLRVRHWFGARRTGILIFVLVVVVHVVSPSPQTGDSRLSVVVAWQLLTTGTIDLSGVASVDRLAWQGDLLSLPDGRLVPFFPWPPMLLALPGAIVLALTGTDPAALSISDPNLTWIIEVPTASILVAATAVVIRRLVLDAGRSWSTPRIGLLVALAYAFTTIAWSAGSRALWQQTVSMLVIALTLLAAQRATRGGPWPWLIGVFGALAFVMRPTNAVFVVAVLVWLLVRDRRAALAALGGGGVVALVFVASSWVLTGSPLPPYYLPTRLGEQPVYGLVESLGVHLISPGRGLLLYVPVVLLAVAGVVLRLRRREFGGFELALVLAVLGQIVVIARFGSTNGFTYGPRLLLDVVPLLMILAAPAFAAVARPRTVAAALALVGVLVVLGWGLFVNASGAVTRAAVCWNVTPTPIDVAPERVWDVADPPFLRPWTAVAAGEPFFVGSCSAD